MGDIQEALAFVDDFEVNGGSNTAWNLDRSQVIQRIRTLIQQPELINQRSLNVCGPAVFFRIWLARDPSSAGTFACEMLRDGSASIGDLEVKAGSSLRDMDYAALRAATDSTHPAATPEGADWMMLSSLRDSENLITDYTGEPFSIRDKIAGPTLPSTLISWLNATAVYDTVSDGTSFIVRPDADQLLNLIPTSNVDNLLLVSSSFNAQMFPSIPPGVDPGPGGAHIPDHYVLATSPFAKSDDSAWLEIEVWSWGRTVAGWTGFADFLTKYFGPIIATLP